MLFGHQNDTNQPAPAAPVADSSVVPATTGGINPLAVDPATGASLPVAQPTLEESEPSVLNQPDLPDLIIPSAPAPSAPALENPPLPAMDPPAAGVPAPTAPITPDAGMLFETEEPEPAETESAPAADVLPEPTPTTETPVAEPAPEPTLESEPEPALSAAAGLAEAPIIADDLLSLKQQAISQLSPLIDQLDQTPEERFRTTMMLIQSTDNASLIPEAYESAQQIVDEKARAQALLDVINEINYFTQKPAA